jgi:flagellar hook assembly protein FlgD
LTIYNQEGRKVRTLVREAKLPGYYDAVWDGRSESGRKLVPGLYLLELRGDNYLVTKEIVLGR